MTKCVIGWNSEHNKDGSCCCNCIYQKKLVRHPWNTSSVLRGSILSQVVVDDDTVFVCVCPDMGDSVISFDKPHGMCEMHRSRKEDKQ